MNAREHQEQGERLVHQGLNGDDYGDHEDRMRALAAAQVHATLALATDPREVEAARSFAAAVEAQNAAALALHAAVAKPDANAGFCAGCDYAWPCPTARALGVS